MMDTTMDDADVDSYNNIVPQKNKSRIRFHQRDAI